jgi:hypothetical protein
MQKPSAFTRPGIRAIVAQPIRNYKLSKTAVFKLTYSIVVKSDSLETEPYLHDP